MIDDPLFVAISLAALIVVVGLVVLGQRREDQSK